VGSRVLSRAQAKHARPRLPEVAVGSERAPRFLRALRPCQARRPTAAAPEPQRRTNRQPRPPERVRRAAPQRAAQGRAQATPADAGGAAPRAAAAAAAASHAAAVVIAFVGLAEEVNGLRFAERVVRARVVEPTEKEEKGGCKTKEVTDDQHQINTQTYKSSTSSVSGFYR